MKGQAAAGRADQLVEACGHLSTAEPGPSVPRPLPGPSCSRDKRLPGPGSPVSAPAFLALGREVLSPPSLPHWTYVDFDPGTWDTVLQACVLRTSSPLDCDRVRDLCLICVCFPCTPHRAWRFSLFAYSCDFITWPQ